jgi:hypothetical protein
MEIKKIIKQGNKNHTTHCCCNKKYLIIISFKFNVEPVTKITGKIVSPIETSYEIIWAAERKAPRNEYFELLDQPAKIIP